MPYGVQKNKSRGFVGLFILRSPTKLIKGMGIIMEFYPIGLRTNYMSSEYAVAENNEPVFSWGAVNSLDNAYQTAFRIVVSSCGECLWDSGIVRSQVQSVKYNGAALKSGAIHEWTLELTDNFGNVSLEARGFFKTVCFDGWSGKWIESSTEKEHEVQYFTCDFTLDKLPERAVLYHCGIGLDKAYINGSALSGNRLQPAFTNYQKECEYITDIVDITALRHGKNIIGIAVGGGWRKNYGHYLDNISETRAIEFMGNIRLNAQLVLYFKDKTVKTIATDGTWKCMSGAITYSHLFNGEVYDESNEKKDWNTDPYKYECKPVEKSPDKYRLRPQLIEPVKEKRRLCPISEYYVDGKHIFDFGENFAGVTVLCAKGRCAGTVRFRIRHAELTDSDGNLFCGPLRGAVAEDIYIAKPGECDILYSPEFTYHGFRYAQLEIEGEFSGTARLEAVSFYTDIDTDNYFKCSDMTVNEFYNCVLRTERANLHSIASDCPQRDERMGWLNDATVRFPALKYSFMPVRLFEKIVGDISNEQDEQGRITCTAPFIYGERPADPVCSSYLIAAKEHYLITGSTELIRKYYDNFSAWNEYLRSRRRDGIVDYSYYGDWAGPADCCYRTDTIGDSDKKKLEEYDTDAANSIYMPGNMISTVFHYINYKLLIEFAELIGKDDDTEHYRKEADIVRKAFSKKWYNGNGIVHNGSQACQALALYAGMLPENDERSAAEVMNNAVAAAGYRLQTANITTPMLINMLMQYGYGDTAWKLLSRKEYPSWGYMIANGATTIWERFELKKSCGMNSHNHPMYGAAVSSLYEGLAGWRVIVPGRKFSINPIILDEVNYYELKIPTISGAVYLKAEHKYGAKTVFISVPFGVTVVFGGREYTSGSHLIRQEEEF